MISVWRRHILRTHRYVAFSFDIVFGMLYNLTTYHGTVGTPDRQNPIQEVEVEYEAFQAAARSRIYLYSGRC